MVKPRLFLVRFPVFLRSLALVRTHEKTHAKHTGQGNIRKRKREWKRHPSKERKRLIKERKKKHKGTYKETRNGTQAFYDFHGSSTFVYEWKAIGAFHIILREFSLQFSSWDLVIILLLTIWTGSNKVQNKWD